jgi:hypothetical protein
MDFSTIAAFLVIFPLIGMNFVLIINVASYKVFPLADAMTRGDSNVRNGRVSCCAWFRVYAFKT